MLAEQRDLIDAIRPSLVMSHLACADVPDHPLNRRQLTAFRAVRVLLPDIPASLANSAGVFLGADYHFDLVRPGIALYGAAALGDAPNPMDAVVTLEGAGAPGARRQARRDRRLRRRRSGPSANARRDRRRRLRRRLPPRGRLQRSARRAPAPTCAAASRR